MDKEILPHVAALERDDSYPTDIVEGMKEMGLFGLMIPEEHGGLGESLLTYALVVEEIARGWMSVSGIINTHFIVAYLLQQHGTDEQKKRSCRGWPPATCAARSRCPSRALGSDVSAISTKAVRDGDEFVITGQKMWITNGGTSNLLAVLVKHRRRGVRDASRTRMTTFLVEKEPGFGEVAARPDHPGEDREDGLQGRRLDRGGLRRATGSRWTGCSAVSPARASTR